MRYDPDIAPSAPLWLSLEEARRIALVEEYHDATALPNARVHAAIHTAVENQIAMNLPSVVAAVARLQAQGLDRHDTVHAIGSVLATHMWGAGQHLGGRSDCRVLRGDGRAHRRELAS